MENIDKKQLRSIGQKINELRKNKGFSFQELADIANMDMDKANLVRICNKGSNFTILTLLQIIEALNCEPNEILNRQDYCKEL